MARIKGRVKSTDLPLARPELLARVGRLEQVAGIQQLGDVAYVVAMEPSTNRDAGRFDARDRGELIHLAPGETRRYRMEIGGLAGADAIEAFSREARAMVPA